MSKRDCIGTPRRVHLHRSVLKGDTLSPIWVRYYGQYGDSFEPLSLFLRPDEYDNGRRKRVFGRGGQYIPLQRLLKTSIVEPTQGEFVREEKAAKKDAQNHDNESIVFRQMVTLLCPPARHTTGPLAPTRIAGHSTKACLTYWARPMYSIASAEV